MESDRDPGDGTASSPPGGPRVRWHLDRPTHRPAAETFLMSGWVAADAEVSALVPARGRFLSFEWVRRPDLVPPPGSMAWARGFSARLDLPEGGADGLTCRATCAGVQVNLGWLLPEAVEPARKARKLDRLRSLFLPHVAVRRGRDFYQVPPAGEALDEPDLVSAHLYPAVVEELIRRHRDGWILDCGAGLRPEYHDNVVNLEIAPFPTTDVLTDAARLPFRDDCFDGVVTLATLEHVRRPWIVAKELVRVLKPGGTLIADVPFLQPVHGYPSHYFNMTSEGLKSLFEETCEVVAADVPHYGRPIFTLAWFLDRYAAGLPEPARSEFLALRVQDLAGAADRQMTSDPVRLLPKASEFELASVTSIVARKR
jgi:SAM-dependent methyltransferase